MLLISLKRHKSSLIYHPDNHHHSFKNLSSNIFHRSSYQLGMLIAQHHRYNPLFPSNKHDDMAKYKVKAIYNFFHMYEHRSNLYGVQKEIQFYF